MTFIIEEICVGLNDLIVEAATEEEALAKYKKGEYIDLDHFPRYIGTLKSSVVIPTEKQKEDFRYKHAMQNQIPSKRAVLELMSK